jgi:type VII secretion integral membrane protein EccD
VFGVLAPTSGLARITIRAPRRRIDLAIPHQVPLAEMLPEVVLRAGEGHDHQTLAATGGWMLRRADGVALSGDVALAGQGVRDGDVLYLVPRNLSWPEPAYDDVVEEIAVGARAHGRMWDVAITRLVALTAASIVLATGLVILLAEHGRPGLGVSGGTQPGLIAVAAALLLFTAGILVSRAVGDGPAGAITAGWGVAYAVTAAALFANGQPAAAQVLVAGSTLLFFAIVGALAVGYGLPLFSAGVTAGVLGTLAGGLGIAVGLPGASAIVVVILVAGIGLVPLLAVRLGRLPLPIVSADPELVAAERRPSPARLRAAVIRADQILVGCLGGIAADGLVCVIALAGSTGVSAPLLAALASVSMLLRSRLFPAVAARLPLLTAGALGLAATAWVRLPGAAVGVRAAVVLVAVIAVVALLSAATSAPRRPRGGGSPYLGRLADVVDITAVIALAPVACAVLGLFGLVRGLVS